nr:glycosyltransferase [Ectothiorhodospira sp. BSL-9]
MSETIPQRSQPKVSILIPSYNTAQFISESINSVLDQDYPNKEVIVIDDGSTDETLNILAAYGDRIRVIQQGNQGAAVARNRGLDVAQGHYIAFLDSDDIWLPAKLSTQIAYLEAHPEIGLVYSRWQTWKPDAKGRFPPPHAMSLVGAAPHSPQASIIPECSGWLYDRLLTGGSLLHTITVVARRELIERVGRFDPELKRGQDYDYWIRASRHTEIHQLEPVLALYRLHGNGCIRKWPDLNYEGLILKRTISRWGLEGPDGQIADGTAVKRRIAQTHFDFAHHHYWGGQPRLAAKSCLEAIQLNPWHTASWRYLAASLAKAIWSRIGAPRASGRTRT